MSLTKIIVLDSMSQITEPITQLLKGKNFAYLSTLMKDGSPQVTPTWIDIDKDGNSILVNTAEGRISAKMCRDPSTISVSDQIIHITWLQLGEES